MPRSWLLFLSTLAVMTLPIAHAAEKRPIKIDDLFGLRRVSDPQISHDGSQVVYVVGTITDAANNKSSSNLWLAACDGKSPPRQLTTTEKKDRHPRWSPDGKRILFESNRSGDNQLWLIDLGGGEASQITHVSTEANNAIWSRDGSHIAFVSAVFPEFSDKPFAESDKLNKQKLEEREKNPVKAKVFTKLFYRHWDSYVEDKRQHLFVMKADGSDVRDVTPGDRDAYPTSTTFESGDNYTFSPDGKYVVFTAVPAKDEAWSTNYDLCRVSIDNKSKEWECLTKDNPAADGAPAFSPDGKMLAFRAQKRAGYEADRWELFTVPTNPNGSLSGQAQAGGQYEGSVESFVWGLDSNTIYFTSDRQGGVGILVLKINGGDGTRYLNWGGTNGSLSISDRLLAYTHAQMNFPSQVFVQELSDLSAQPVVRNLSDPQEMAIRDLALPRPESVNVAVEGAEMQMWILKPPGFDASKKYPLAYLVHGGPQGAWNDAWSFRWNPQVWAAQGYVVAMPNPRGSTGFGQKYVDEISGDWGGKCYDDLMKGVDYLEKLPYIDKDRMAAAGGSFGGYMMNWFAVNTGRFKCLISHCSVYNFESMYATTDEVWFDEWEHGGPPWGKNRDSYEKHSPHRLAANLGKFKTPMLLIQNDLDFRCPVAQGLELFTALQRQGVPSRLINFPDEGHWVLKPANSKRWHEEVFAWLTKYVPPGGK